jgi:hypothetical protein
VCALEVVLEEHVEGQGTLEDGLVMGHVVGGNPKAESGMGGEDLVVIYDEVGDHREQVVINKHIITSGRDLGIRGDACVFPWGLSPDLGFGSQVNPSFSSKKIAENGDVPRLSVEVPTNARWSSGVGRNLLAYGLPDEICLMGLALVGVASNMLCPPPMSMLKRVTRPVATASLKGWVIGVIMVAR